MSIKEIENKAKELQELKRLREELDAEMAALEDEIKDFMGDQERIVAGAFRITWRAVTSSRIDTTALKNAMPDVAAQFMKQTTTRRFTVA